MGLAGVLPDTTELPLYPRRDRIVGAVGDALDLQEVQDVYLPGSRLLSLYVESARSLHHQQEQFLGAPSRRTRRSVIGLAGSVAVGKFDRWASSSSCPQTAAAPPRRAGPPPTAPSTPTPNSSRCGLSQRKGFPESYDRRALLRFVVDVKSGKNGCWRRSTPPSSTTSSPTST